MKKIWMTAACAALVLCLGLTACGSGGDDVTKRITMSKSATGSGAGITAALSGSAVGMSSAELTEEEKADLTDITICKDAIAVVVHKDNPAESITLADLKKIYLKEKTSFTEGGENIVVVSRDSSSGTRKAFEEIVGLKGVEYVSDEEQKETSGVQEYVSRNKNAIGYLSFGSLDTSKVKALKIEGVACSAENVKNGTYAMQRPFVLCYKKGKALTAVEKDFLEVFLKSAEAQKVIADEKYVTVAENPEPYVKTDGMKGELVFNGSTSVDPLLDLLFARYLELNR